MFKLLCNYKEPLTTTHWLQFACASSVASAACRSFQNPVSSAPRNWEMSYAEPVLCPWVQSRKPLFVPEGLCSWWESPCLSPGEEQHDSGTVDLRWGNAAAQACLRFWFLFTPQYRQTPSSRLKVKTLQKSPVKGSGVRETPGMRRQPTAQPWDPGVRLSDILA